MVGETSSLRTSLSDSTEIIPKLFREGERMSKRVTFSIVIEDPQLIEVGSGIHFEGKLIIVTSINKVEFVNSTAVLVSGKGTI